MEFCRNDTRNGIVSMGSLQGFRIGYILFYVNHVRATMMERSYKSNMMKCNLFVQVVILNIEFLKMYSFVALTCF